MKEKMLKIMPFVASLTGGTLIYVLAITQDDNTKNLFMNISATFISIPLIYLVFDLSKSYSQKRLQKEIFDYAKLQVDSGVLSNIKQVQKLTLGLSKYNSSLIDISKFLNLSKQDIRTIVSENEYIGFQVLKSWENTG